MKLVGDPETNTLPKLLRRNAQRMAASPRHA